jgi:hypothetical protein
VEGSCSDIERHFPTTAMNIDWVKLVTVFCDVRQPKDVLKFFYSFVYLWPWVLAIVYGLFQLGAMLPGNIIIFLPGLLAAEALCVHASTISPYRSKYHLVDALKVTCFSFAAIVAGIPSIVVLSDWLDNIIRSYVPNFLEDQLLYAKLGICTGLLLNLVAKFKDESSQHITRKNLSSSRVIIPIPERESVPADAGEIIVLFCLYRVMSFCAILSVTQNSELYVLRFTIY